MKTIKKGIGMGGVENKRVPDLKLDGGVVEANSLCQERSCKKGKDSQHT